MPIFIRQIYKFTNPELGCVGVRSLVRGQFFLIDQLKIIYIIIALLRKLVECGDIRYGNRRSESRCQKHDLIELEFQFRGKINLGYYRGFVVVQSKDFSMLLVGWEDKMLLSNISF